MRSKEGMWGFQWTSRAWTRRRVSGSPPNGRWRRGRWRSGDAEQKAHGYGHGGGDIAGQRAVDAYIHQSVAVGDAGADLNDGAGCAAERGSGQNPGQRGADAVPAAGEIMAEFVDEQNAEQRAENAQPVMKSCGWRASQAQGHRSLSRTTGGSPRKFCMKRAPLAVVVTTLAPSSSSGRPYLRKVERTGLLLLAAAGRPGMPHRASVG